jgi:hypothetical protein
MPGSGRSGANQCQSQIVYDNWTEPVRCTLEAGHDEAHWSVEAVIAWSHWSCWERPYIRK